MKILWKQQGEGSLARFGVAQCYCKRLCPERDGEIITKKRHHHAGFEVHMVAEGLQIYEAEGKEYRVGEGEFLFLAPGVSHRAGALACGSRKFALSFTKKTKELNPCFQGRLSSRMLSHLEFLTEESERYREHSCMLMENCITELLVELFRLAGLREESKKKGEEDSAVIALAKRYVCDNVETALTVTELAQYCHLSTRQLTRLFWHREGSSPGEYIKKQRALALEKRILEKETPLSRISEEMHFGSEYYMNAFFKKHFGMPPGEYRKMHGR